MQFNKHVYFSSILSLFSVPVAPDTRSHISDDCLQLVHPGKKEVKIHITLCKYNVISNTTENILHHFNDKCIFHQMKP